MKMRLLFSSGLIIFLAAMLLFDLPCSGGETAIEKIGNAGSIDWVSRKLTATGIGVPTKKAVGRSQMRAMVRRAAVVVARRNLLEVVKGVQIDSTTRVRNFMVKSDTIESRVKGILSGSSVEKVEVNDNGTATATVSIPLKGRLEEMLMRMVVAPPESPGAPLPLKEIDSRVRFLEKRVRALEEKIGTLKRTSVSQKQMLMMFRSFAKAWLEVIETGPIIAPVGFSSNLSGEDLRKKFEKQEALLGQITARLDDMSVRLKKIENRENRPVAVISKSTVNYTGLVIDARRTGFRPCLKPEIFGRGRAIYPGSYINRETAIRTGYVRYYRNLAKAQRSSRVGSLPLTIKATGARDGKRSLSINMTDTKALEEISVNVGGFMANCRVVIVF